MAGPTPRRVGCCHPYCITHYCPGCVAVTLITFTLQGVLLPPLLHVLVSVLHSTTVVPFTAKQLYSFVALFVWFFLHVFLSGKVVKRELRDLGLLDFFWIDEKRQRL